MRIHFGLGIVALCCATPALASDWWFVDTGSHKPNRSVVFVDKDSLRQTSSPIYEIWEDIIYETPVADFKFKKSTKLKVRIDCQSRTTANLSWISYDAQDEVVDSFTEPSYEVKPEAVAPDTIGDEIVNFACGLKTNTWSIGQDKTPKQYATAVLYLIDHPPSKAAAPTSAPS